MVPGLSTSSSSSSCKYHTSNDVFLWCKSVHKMATGKSDDELIQLDNKMRIWTRSGKFRKVENPELSMAWWQSMTRTPMTTSMIAWHCTMRPTTDHFHWHPHERKRAQSSFVLSVHHLHTHRGSRLKMSESFHVISIVMSMVIWAFLLDLISLSISCTSSRPLSSSSSSWSSW